MLVNYPKFVDLNDYHKAIEEMVGVLSTYTGVKAVFQVGGLSSPGISDIDLVVVFENGAKCSKEPLLELSHASRYLFTHGLFGTCEKHLQLAEQQALFGSYRKLWGVDMAIDHQSLPHSKVFEQQMAMEYLVKMFIIQKMEEAYGIYNVRNFLLLGKAIETDLDLLGIEDSELRNQCSALIAMRKNWFGHEPSAKEMVGFIQGFNRELESLLLALFQDHPFFLPNQFSGRMSRNIVLSKGSEIGVRMTGWVPSVSIGNLIFGKKYPKLLNRLTNFTITIPHQKEQVPPQIAQRFSFFTEATHYNKNHIPAFGVPGIVLNAFQS